jgi:fructose-bisphosphate aldolase, class II
MPLSFCSYQQHGTQRDKGQICNTTHGGSGTPEAQFRGSVAPGISKINSTWGRRQAYRTTLEAQLQAHPEQVAVVKRLGPVRDAVQTVVEPKLDVFGAAGKRVL